MDLYFWFVLLVINFGYLDNYEYINLDELYWFSEVCYWNWNVGYC